jgi:ATP-dependent Clp protease ATP-binding subunit ClpC
MTVADLSQNVPFPATILMIILIIAVFQFAKIRNRIKEQRKRNAAAPAAQPAQNQPAVEILPPSQQLPLAGQLHQLESALAAFAANTAHPRELCETAEFRHAIGLLADKAVPLETVMQYAHGANWVLSCAALAALPERQDRASVVDQVIANFDRLAVWAMYFALEYFNRLDSRPPAGAPAIAAKDWWRDNPVLLAMFRDYFSRREAWGDAAVFGPALALPSVSPVATIRAFLERVNHPYAALLIVQLEDYRHKTVDQNFLAAFGRFWSDSETEILIAPERWHQPLATAEATLHQPLPRSLLVAGEEQVGKTSLLRLLAERVKKEGWRVFEASGADLMADQQWFGQLEGRLRRATEEITVAKRLIWYVPDLLQLARSGTHPGQSASMLEQILPAIRSGRVVIWTEASPAAAARLLQIRPALRSILDVVRLESQSEQDTLGLARGVIALVEDEHGFAFEPDCAEIAVSSARQYLGSGGLPGSALNLIKLTVLRADARIHFTSGDILETLSQLTGLPISILNNKERIDLGAMRGFFSARVIGQDEAVASVVDRIAMLKAGLSDPDRPIGVFLFAGPTGTGKTELAKTTAEFLFGSEDRLVRLDMSEFQTADSVNNILASGLYGEAQSLVQRVRKQPFSVVLLDEFEKAHPRIWDLFLQVFDEGRLSDTLGQVTDFRHCLIVLTTNLGVSGQKDAGFGFASARNGFSVDDVMRAVRQTYRPEFQNRLDKIIVFRPLTRELMRIILRKELKSVLDRRGFKDRAWAVEWESSALEFLLEKGFSSEMGARPLKRAIDHYVIAPLAGTIVERRFPEGEQFVFFRSDGHSIQAEFVDPDADDVPAAAAAVEPAVRRPNLPSIILAPEGTTAELETVSAQSERLEQGLASAQWHDLKQALSEQMSREEFWKSPDRYQTLARLALMDRVAAAMDTAQALRKRLERGATRPQHYSRQLLSRLALQLWLIKSGIDDVFEGAAVEVAIAVEPALEGAAGEAGETRAWCHELLDMYRAWSRNRRMQTTELAGTNGSLSILLVAGFGAQRVLNQECGLHILEFAESGNGMSRATARVRLVPTPLEELSPAKMRTAVLHALAKAAGSSAVIRRYRKSPSPLVRNADSSWRSGRFDAVLRGDFDLLPAAEER